MNKLVFTLCIILFSYSSFASELHAPPNFMFQNKKIVFVDFLNARYDITYDLNQQLAFATSTIEFSQFETGFPVIDHVENPTEIVLNDQYLQSSIANTPLRETNVRFIDQQLPAGNYKIKITSPISNLVAFKNGTVNSAFWNSDLEDRSFLEQYLPANFEFDQVSMKFNIKFIGSEVRQRIYTNGNLKWTSNFEASIEFPSYFTSSSLFFHTASDFKFNEINYSYPSISGSSIPVKIYTSANAGEAGLQKGQELLNKTLAELESDYGAFPHPRIIVYLANPGMGLGGMEYCGATISELSALSHEVFHSYIGRGIMPANGNAGWIDEAIASWRDGGYKNTGTMNGASVNMSDVGPHYRKTKSAAYTHGERFIGFLNFKLSSRGGIRPFLKKYLSQNVFVPYTVESFAEAMESFYGIPIYPEFRAYTYSGIGKFQELKSHKKADSKQLQNLL